MGASRLLVTFNQNIILCIKKEDLVLDILLCQDIKHSLYGLQMFSASRIDTNRDPFYLCMKIGCKIYQLIEQSNGKIIDTEKSHILHHLHRRTFARTGHSRQYNKLQSSHSFPCYLPICRRA